MFASQKNIVGKIAVSQATAVVIESLEGRQYLSGHRHTHRHPAAPAIPAAPTVYVPVTITPSGSTLTLAGSSSSDLISLSQSGSNFTIANGSWSTQITGTFTNIIIQGNGGNDSITVDASVTESCDIYGGAGNDSITGGAGNSRIFAGAGANVINGGAGNDTIVAVGSASDSLTGGAGTDSFWLDDSATELVTDMSAVEKSAGHVHKIGGFLGGASKTSAASTLVDPAVTDGAMSYKNFASVPLFTDSGPAENDIVQGYVGDCWYLASLSSVAKVNGDRIRQSVVDLGDGSYAVQFNRNGTSVFVRVNADLPTWYGNTSQVAYANVTNTSGQNSLWVAIMEKAMTEFRGSATAPSYSAIDGGWMSDAYSALGFSSTNLWGAASATDWASQISAALAANDAVTFATTANPGGNLIGGHAYTVDHMGVDAKGNTTITLRNPWGVDGAGSDGANDGYVTLTVQQAYAACVGSTIAIV